MTRLRGGASQTSKLIGFVHNPEPGPVALFDVTRSLLACIGTDKRHHKVDRWLSITNQDGLAPVETVRQVCLAWRQNCLQTDSLGGESARLGSSNHCY